jgi:hypothetical protein
MSLFSQLTATMLETPSDVMKIGRSELFQPTWGKKPTSDLENGGKTYVRGDQNYGH